MKIIKIKKNDCAFAQWSRPTKRFKLAFTTLSMRRPCSQTQSKVLHKIRNRGYNIVNIPVSVMHVFMYKVSNSMFLRERERERESPIISCHYHTHTTHQVTTLLIHTSQLLYSCQKFCNTLHCFYKIIFYKHYIPTV